MPKALEAVQNDPGDVQARARLGAIYLELKRWADAEKQLQAARRLSPKHSVVLQLHGRALTALGRLSAAHEAYQVALTADPTWRPTYLKSVLLTWADALLKRLDTKPRRPDVKLVSSLSFEILSALGERGARLLELEGDYWFRSGANPGALQAYERAQTLPTKRSALDFKIGRCKTALGDMDHAITSFDAYIGASENPTERLSRLRKVAAHLDGSFRFRTARRYFKEAMRLAPEDRQLLWSLASLHLKMGAHDDARTLINEALLGKSPSQEDLQRAAKLFQRYSQRADSIAVWRRAIAASPKDIRLWKTLATTLRKSGRLGELQSIIGYPQEHRLWGDLYVSIRDYKRAQRHFEQALRGDGPPEVWLQLATVFHHQGQNRQRDKAYKRYLSVASEPKRALATVASAYDEIQEHTKALPYWRQLIKRAPDHHGAVFAIARRYRKKKDWPAEKQLLKSWAGRPGDSAERGRRWDTIGHHFLQRNDPTYAQTAFENVVKEGETPHFRAALLQMGDLNRLHFKSMGQAQKFYRKWIDTAAAPARSEARKKVLKRIGHDRRFQQFRHALLKELVQDDPTDPEGHRRLALSYGRQRPSSPVDALRAWERFIDRSADRTAATIAAGTALINTGGHREAAQLFLRIPLESIVDAALHLRLGQLFMRVQDYPRAERHLERYLAQLDRITSTTQRSLVRLARDAKRRGMYNVSVALYRRLLPHARDKAGTLFALGEALLGQGDDTEAINVFERYLTTVGARRRALERVAATLYQKRFLRHAATYYERLFSGKNPRHIGRAFPRLIDIHIKLGDRAAVRALAARYVRLSTNEFTANRDAARYLQLAGLFDDAFQFLKRAAELRPALTKLWEQLADLAFRVGKDDEAEAALRQLITKRGHTVDAWVRAAELLSQSGHDGRALALLDDAVSHGRANSKLYVLAGEIRLRQGKVEEAHRDFVDALSRSDEVDETLKRIRVSYVLSGQFERLQDVLRRAQSLQSSRIRTWLELGQVALQLGRIEEARKYFAQYVEMNQEGGLDVAKELEKAGDLRGALAYYDRALRQPLNSKREEALARMIRTLTSRGSEEEIAKTIRRYLLAVDGGAKHLKPLANLLVKSGRHGDAIQFMIAHQQRSPTPAGWRQVGRYSLLVGDDYNAKKAFTHYLEESHTSRRRTLRRKGRTSGVHERTLQVADDYEEVGQEAEALARIRHAVGQNPEHAGLQACYSRLLLQRGEVTSAMVALESISKAKTLDTLRTSDLMGIHRLSVLAGREAEVGGVLRGVPLEQWTVELALALVSLGLKTKDKGLVESASATLSNATVPVAARLGLGLAHYQAGELDKAAEYLRAVLVPGTGTRAIQPAVQTLLKIGLEQRDSDVVSEVATLVGRVLENRRQFTREMTIALMQTGFLDAAAQFAGEWISSTASRPTNSKEKPADQSRLELWHALVHIHLLRGDSEAAIQAVDRWIADASNPRAMRINVARLLVERMEYVLANRYYADAIRLDRANRPLRLEAAEVAFHLGRENDAMSHIDAYLSDGDDDKNSRRQVAELFLKFNRKKLAATYFERGGFSNPGNEYSRVLLWLKQAETAKAKAIVKASIEHSADPLVSTARYIGLYLVGNVVPPSFVLELVSTAMRTKPVHPVVLLARAAALAELGRDKEARSALMDILQKKGADIAALYDSNKVQGPQKSITESVRIFLAKALRGHRLDLVDWALQEGSRRDPSSPNIERLVHELQSAMEDPRSAWTDAEKMILRRLGMERLDTLMARTSNAAWAISARSSFYEHTGDIAAAIFVYRKAIERAPSDATLYNNLAYLLARRGMQLDDAMQLVQKAERLEPSDRFYFYDTEGWILYRQGRYKEALERIQSAIRYGYEASDSSLSETHHHLGKVLQALGRKEESAKAFFRAWQLEPTGIFGSLSVPSN
jgi:tetratricopeptide (TPR) repeat protein